MERECQECGSKWESYRAYSSHFMRAHDGNALVSLVGEDALKSMYETMSEQEVSQELDVARQTVKKALLSIDVDRRGQTESMHKWYEGMTKEERMELVKPAHRARTSLPRFYTHVNGYECINHLEKNVRVNRLLAVAEYGFDAVEGMHVHHKNRIPWDNRPDNIELLTPEEHARHHALENELWNHGQTA